MIEFFLIVIAIVAVAVGFFKSVDKDNKQDRKEKHLDEDDGLEDFIWFNMINKH